MRRWSERGLDLSRRGLAAGARARGAGPRACLRSRLAAPAPAVLFAAASGRRRIPAASFAALSALEHCDYRGQRGVTARARRCVPRRLNVHGPCFAAAEPLAAPRTGGMPPLVQPQGQVAARGAHEAARRSTVGFAARALPAASVHVDFLPCLSSNDEWRAGLAEAQHGAAGRFIEPGLHGPLLRYLMPKKSAPPFRQQLALPRTSSSVACRSAICCSSWRCAPSTTRNFFSCGSVSRGDLVHVDEFLHPASVSPRRLPRSVELQARAVAPV